MASASDGGYGYTNGHGTPSVTMRTRLQELLDEKEKQLQQAGALGQRILGQQMELEERINQISELESGRTGLKDDEIESELRSKLNELADLMQSWATENERMWSGFGPKSADEPLSVNHSVPDIPHGDASPSPFDGPSAAQSSRRAKNAAHRANDVEFAFEIGSSLLTEVRRLQSLLAERDKALQDLKDEKDDLERSIERLNAVLKSQENETDKFKEENWNLEVEVQGARTQLIAAQSESQRAESDLKRTLKQLEKAREAADAHKKEAEEFANTIEDLRNKHETEYAQMRKQQATLQREKQDLQTAIDALKSDLEKKGRTIGRFGSPMTPNAEPRTPARLGDFPEEEEVYGMSASVRRRTDTSLAFTDMYGSEMDPSPDPSPIRIPVPNQAAAELETLKQSLAHAHRQIATLKNSLQREKQLKGDFKRKLGEVSGDSTLLVEDLDDEIEVEDASPVPVRSNSSGRRGRGSAKRRSITRSSRGLTLGQRLAAAAREGPDSPTRPHSQPEIEFEPVTEEEEGEDEDTLEANPELSQEQTEIEASPLSKSGRPASIASVDGMDPTFANVLRRSNSSRHRVGASPLRVISNSRMARRSRGGGAYKPERPSSIVNQPTALAAELGFEEDSSAMELMRSQEPEEVEVAVETAEIGIQCELVPSVVPSPPELPAAPETIEIAIQSTPPPVKLPVMMDIGTQSAVPVQDAETLTDPLPEPVTPTMSEMGINTTEAWPEPVVVPAVVSVPVTTEEAATSPIKPVFRESVQSQSTPRQSRVAPPSSFRDPALFTHKADTDTEGETEYEDAHDTVAPTTPAQSFAELDAFQTAESVADQSSDSDAESIKVSRLHLRRPVAPPTPPPVPITPIVEYSTAEIQVEEPKKVLKDGGVQTDEWIPPPPPANNTLYRVGPQAQQFQFISSPSTPISTPAALPAVPALPVVGAANGAAQKDGTRSRMSSTRTSTRSGDESSRPSAPLLATPSRVDRSRPPTMMLPPPPRLPPPPSMPPPPTSSTPKPTPTSSAPQRPTSPPPAELIQRATTPTIGRSPAVSMHSLPVPPRGAIRQPTTSLPSPHVRQPPSTSSFRSATSTPAAQQLPPAVLSEAADLRRKLEAASTASGRRSTSSRRPSISSSISSDQHHVRILEPNPLDSTPGPRTNGEQATDPGVIHAITQTMIGEYLYKYTRKAIGKGHAERRHRRFFWIHPYTKTIYWSSVDPGASNVTESSAKSAYIESVKSVLDPNPMPPGLHQYSVVVTTANREMKFTAPTKERHDIWFNALQYLLARPSPNGPPATPGRPPLSPTSARQSSLTPGNHRQFVEESPRSQRSARSGLTTDSWNITPRAQRSSSRLSNYPGSIGKRAGTPAAEYLRYNSNPTEPVSPSSAYEHIEAPSYDDDLDFHVHDHHHEGPEFEGLDNVRACCDGKHDVGTLSSPRGHHHHHHHHQNQPPLPSLFSGTVRSMRSGTDVGTMPKQGYAPERPVSPTWSFKSGKSRTGSSHEPGSSMFSWSRKSRKETSKP